MGRDFLGYEDLRGRFDWEDECFESDCDEIYPFGGCGGRRGRVRLSYEDDLLTALDDFWGDKGAG